MPKIAKVLCNHGSEATDLDVNVGEDFSTVLDQAGRALDGAYLTNVVVVRAANGKYYVGEFEFRFRAVTPKVARQVARNFREP